MPHAPVAERVSRELGFVIDSPVLAAAVEDAFTRQIPAQYYQVKLDAQGRLHWLEPTSDGVVRHDTEPGTTWWKRTGVRLMSWLPIEWLL